MSGKTGRKNNLKDEKVHEHRLRLLERDGLGYESRSKYKDRVFVL